MTDDELIDAYHEALCNYQAAKSACGNRVDAFVQLVSAEVALIGRFGSEDYLRHYNERYPTWPAIAAVPGARLIPAAASGSGK